MFSDGGSTPPASTKIYSLKLGSLGPFNGVFFLSPNCPANFAKRSLLLPSGTLYSDFNTRNIQYIDVVNLSKSALVRLDLESRL